MCQKKVGMYGRISPRLPSWVDRANKYRSGHHFDTDKSHVISCDFGPAKDSGERVRFSLKTYVDPNEQQVDRLLPRGAWRD